MADTPVVLDEQAVANRLASGDEEALRLFVSAYGPRVRGWLNKHFGETLQEAERDEAFNVATFNAWRFAERFDSSKGSLGGWYLKIAQRASEGILRRSNRHRSKHLEYDPAYDPTVDSADRGESDGLFSLECIRDLERLIKQRLVGLQRTIIEADIAAGGQADNQRLADLCNTSVGSIKVSRNKARKNLLQAMIELGYDEAGRKKQHG